MDRSFQKTAFFNIEIGDSSGQGMIPLPYQLKRLVEKVEIKEMMTTGGCTGGQFTITFNEGSREPFNNDTNVDTSTAYPVGGSGSISNATGMLADIHYVQQAGNTGITSIFPSATGIINDTVGASVSAIDSSSPILDQTSPVSPTLIVIDDKVVPPKAIKYLFQQRNRIKITWGYLEDLQNRRSVSSYIAGVDYEYPENDNPKMIITSVEPGMHLDQVSAIKGTKFANSTSSGVTPFGKPIVNYENLSVKKLIELFCTDANLETPLVSQEFDSIYLEKNAVNIIPAGMSANQFFGELAKKYDAYYKVYISPASNRDTIVFLSKREFCSRLVINSKQILSYKTPGALIKSVKLKAEYNALPGNTQAGVDDTGKQIAVATNSSVSVAIVDAVADLIDVNPTSNNSSEAATGSMKSLNTPFAVGTHGYSAEANDVSAMSRVASSKANCQLGGIVTVSLNAIGFARFRPGSWYVGGLGQRYSGTYYFHMVTHTIDANGGYVCVMEGSNQADYGGLGKEAPTAKSEVPESQEAAVGLFSTASVGTPTASSVYHDSMEVV